MCTYCWQRCSSIYFSFSRVFVCLPRTGQNPLHLNYINASAIQYTFAFWFASSSTQCIPFATISNRKMCGFCVVCTFFFFFFILLCDGLYYFSFGLMHTKNQNTHTIVLISITFCIQSLWESDFCCCWCRWNNIRNMNERLVCAAFSSLSFYAASVCMCAS